MNKVGTRRQANGVVFEGLSSSAYPSPIMSIYSVLGVREQVRGTAFAGLAGDSYIDESLQLKNVYHNGVQVVTRIHNGYPVLKHYHNGVLVWNVDAGITPSYFTMAEMPEQVFAEGYARTVNLDQYLLDPTNLYPTKKLPWLEASGFTSNYQVDLIVESGVLPSSITWDKESSELIYDGAALAGDNEILSCYFEYLGNVGPSFKIKLLAATLEWAFTDSSTALFDAVNTAFGANTRDENVVVIKDGEWTDEELKTGGTNYMACFANRDNVYILGDGSMPIVSGTGLDWTQNDNYPLNTGSNYVQRLMLHCDDTPHIYIHGIDFRFAVISSVNCEYGVLDNVISRLSPGGYDFWIYSLIDEQTTNPTFFISNFLTYHYGSDEKKHPVYGECTDRYSDVASGLSGSVYLNNYVAYENRAPGEPHGGHCYKDISDSVKIRNSWMSLAEDPSNPDFDRINDRPLLSLHSTQKVVLFNNDFYNYYDTTTAPSGWEGTPTTVLFQNRNMPSAIGMYKPSYFNYPAMRTNTLNEREKEGYDCWENWSGNDVYSGAWQSTKNPEFHGTINAANTYSTDGAKDNVTPNTNPAPTTAPFWDTLGTLSSVVSDKAFGKFLSFNRFHTIATATPNSNKTAVTSRTSAPTSYVTSGTSLGKDFLPVPTNWKERTWLHHANNTFDEEFASAVTYEYDFEEPARIRYPYSVDEVAATGNNYTDHGGDIVDGVGTNIILPAGFKI